MDRDVISHMSTIFMYEVFGRPSETETNIVANTFKKIRYVEEIRKYLEISITDQHTSQVYSNHSFKEERLVKVCCVRNTD